MKNTKIISALITAAFLAALYSCTTNECVANTEKEMSVDATTQAKAAFDTTCLIRITKK